ncbi:UNVERIFIED_CONTAM: hypothetical protein FKN15_064810 [Acipenser sinensis]
MAPPVHSKILQPHDFPGEKICVLVQFPCSVDYPEGIGLQGQVPPRDSGVAIFHSVKPG